MSRPAAKDVAVSMVGLLLLGNLLTAVFEIDGTAWLALRILLAGVLAGALIGLLSGWLIRRRSTARRS